jgi:predicted MFS family arabinose efflux permease
VAAEFGFGGLAIGLMLAGVMSGPIDVALLTLRQRRTDPQQLGRVMSISMSLNLAGFPLGSALAGMVITSSLSTTFVLAGIASVVAAVATISIPADTKAVA